MYRPGDFCLSLGVIRCDFFPHNTYQSPIYQESTASIDASSPQQHPPRAHRFSILPRFEYQPARSLTDDPDR